MLSAGRFDGARAWHLPRANSGGTQSARCLHRELLNDVDMSPYELEMDALTFGSVPYDRLSLRYPEAFNSSR